MILFACEILRCILCHCVRIFSGSRMSCRTQQNLLRPRRVIIMLLLIGPARPGSPDSELLMLPSRGAWMAWRLHRCISLALKHLYCLFLLSMTLRQLRILIYRRHHRLESSALECGQIQVQGRRGHFLLHLVVIGGNYPCALGVSRDS